MSYQEIGNSCLKVLLSLGILVSFVDPKFYFGSALCGTVFLVVTFLQNKKQYEVSIEESKSTLEDAIKENEQLKTELVSRMDKLESSLGSIKLGSSYSSSKR